MPFDAMPEGEPWRPWCRSCKQTIQSGQTLREVNFTNPAHGELRDLNGPYHEECARPFLSLAHVINLNPFAGF